MFQDAHIYGDGTCKLGDLRWVQVVNDKGGKVSWMYFYVDTLGNASTLDKVFEDPDTGWMRQLSQHGNLYYCVPCRDEFDLWQDAERHIEPENPEEWDSDEQSPSYGKFKYRGKWK